MKKLPLLALIALLLLPVVKVEAPPLEPEAVVQSTGGIGSGTPLGTVDYFSIRLVDFMPLRDTFPNMDDRIYVQRYQATIDELASASTNGEITHVQLRLYWQVDPSNTTDWNYPRLGSPDTSQAELMNSWRRWYFGEGLPDGESAIERIKARGFKVSVGLSVSWNTALRTTNVPPPLGRYAVEADFPTFDGDLFVSNYMQNVLRPVAELAASSGLLDSGDIFFIGFENYDPSAEHPRLHSAAYSSMLIQLRSILPQGVLISEDVQGWWEDRILGLSSPNGVLNIPYLGDLDFIAISMWVPWLSTSDLPATPQEVRDAHFSNMRFEKRYTGYNGVPAVPGRDFMLDFQDIYTRYHKRVLMNSGLRNVYASIASTTPEGTTGAVTPEGIQEQADFWAGRLLALNGQDWCAGQDFERYVEASTYTTYTTSVRGRPAQTEIINGIRTILGL